MEAEKDWTCRRCGWTYPNPHPSAKHRRNHKKHCGKKDIHVEGGSSDEASSDEGHHHSGKGAVSVEEIAQVNNAQTLSVEEPHITTETEPKTESIAPEESSPSGPPVVPLEHHDEPLSNPTEQAQGIGEEQQADSSKQWEELLDASINQEPTLDAKSVDAYENSASLASNAQDGTFLTEAVNVEEHQQPITRSVAEVVILEDCHQDNEDAMLDQHKSTHANDVEGTAQCEEKTVDLLEEKNLIACEVKTVDPLEEKNPNACLAAQDMDLENEKLHTESSMIPENGTSEVIDEKLHTESSIIPENGTSEVIEECLSVPGSHEVKEYKISSVSEVEKAHTPLGSLFEKEAPPSLDHQVSNSSKETKLLPKEKQKAGSIWKGLICCTS